MTEKRIAVVVLNYNSSADCKKCISFLKKQKGVEQEIVVVDNCSQEDDREAVEQMCKEQECTFIANHENKGYSAGNNIGLRYAAEKGYEYALIANPDMEFPQEDYLQRIVFVMEKNKDIGVCGSDIVDLENNHQNPLHLNTYWDDFFGFLRTNKYKNDNDTHWRESRRCDVVHGCCLMVRTDFLKEIGFLDEHTFLYCEERIMGRLIENTNYIMYYMSEATAVHHHVKSEKGNVRVNFKRLLESRVYYYRRYTNYGKLARGILYTSERIQFYLISQVSNLKRR